MRPSQDSPFLLPRPLLTGLFAGAAIVVAHDPGPLLVTSCIFDAFYYVFPVLLFLFLLRDRQWRDWRRFIGALAAWGGAFLAGVAVHWVDPFMETEELLDHALEHRSVFFLPVTLFLAWPLLRVEKGDRAGQWIRSFVVPMLVYLLYCYVTTIHSSDYKRSFDGFVEERLLPFGFLFCWLRAVRSDRRLASQTGLAALLGLAVLMAVGTLVGLANAFGGEKVVTFLARWGALSLRAPLQMRLTFPVWSLNACGYLCAMTAMLMGIGLCGRRVARRGWLRYACYLLPFFAVSALLFNSTRTACFGLLACAVLWLFLALPWRRSVPVAGFCIVVVMVFIFSLPGERRSFFMQPFHVKTYLGGGPKTSMHSRVAIWHWGVGAIQERPFFGWGYNYRVVRKLLTRDVREAAEDDELLLFLRHRESHMHNLWLETAAESGIPAAVLLLVFMVARWRLLLRYYRRAEGALMWRAAGWIALESLLLIMGMALYMLKWYSGWWTWIAWVYGATEAAFYLADQEEQTEEA